MNTLPSWIFTRFNILAVIYLAVIWLSASQSFQYKTSVALESNFPGDAQSWSVRGDIDNTLISPEKIGIIPNSNQRTFLSKTYVVDRENIEKSYLSVKADIVSRIMPSVRVSETEPGPWQPSLFYVWFGDSEGKRLEMRHVSILEPVNRTVHASSIFHVPKDAHTVTVEMFLRKFQSQHEIMTLDVRQIEETVAYKALLGVLVLLPVIALFMYWHKFRYSMSVIPISSVTVVALVLVVGVLMPGKPLTMLLTAVNTIAPQINRVVQHFSAVSVQDALHFLGFLLLALVTLVINEKMRYQKLNILSKLILFAVFTEVIQRHSIERSPSMVDIVLDLCGLVLGVLIWFSCNLAISRWRQRSELA